MKQKNKLRLSLGLIIALAFSTFIIAPGASAAISNAEREQQIINTIFVHTNAIRAKAGLPALTYSAKIGRISQNWARHMGSTQKMVHSTTFHLQMPAGWRMAAENIAMSPNGSGASVTEQWRKSPGHYKNMTGDFNQIGIGVYVDKDGVLWSVQNFGKYPTGSKDAVPGAGKPLDTKSPAQGQSEKEKAAAGKKINADYAVVKSKFKESTTLFNQAKANYNKAVTYNKHKKATKNTAAAVKKAKASYKKAKERYVKVKENKSEADWYYKITSLEIVSPASLSTGVKKLDEATRAIKTNTSALKKEAANVKAHTATAKDSLIVKKATKITGWDKKSVKVKKGKAVKKDVIKVTSNVKKVYLQSRVTHVGGKKVTNPKWVNVRTIKVTKGKAAVTFPKTTAKVKTQQQFRVKTKATKTHKAQVTKVKKVTVR